MKATVYIDAKRIDSANNLTLYIDDQRICSFDGGCSRIVQVDPGYHTIQMQVYNDCSEHAYFLNPLSVHCEPGGEYDLTI